MSIPQSVIERVSTYLGADGKPHLVEGGNARVDSGCMEWPLPPDSEGYHVFECRRTELIQMVMELHEGGREAEAEQLFNTIEDKIAPFQPQTPEQDVNAALFEIRQLVKDAGVTVYRSDLSWTDIRSAKADSVVIAATADQYEILRIEDTFASNQNMDTEEIIRRLQTLDTEYGIDIVGASGDVIDLLFKRVPQPNTPEFEALRQKLVTLCVEVEYEDLDLSMRRVALWWD